MSFDIGSQLEAIFRAWEGSVQADAQQIVEEVTREAVEDMRRIIESAVTDTGRARAAAGTGLGQPGRIESSAMISDVTFALERDMDGSIVGTWGWVDHFEDYYIYQEEGRGHFSAMSALQGSYVQAREKLRERLRDAGFEVQG